jgi:predicted PP-loop superfamily ATPase
MAWPGQALEGPTGLGPHSLRNPTRLVAFDGGYDSCARARTADAVIREISFPGLFTAARVSTIVRAERIASVTSADFAL